MIIAVARDRPSAAVGCASTRPQPTNVSATHGTTAAAHNLLVMHVSMREVRMATILMRSTSVV
jgi:hypothetical protein